MFVFYYDNCVTFWTSKKQIIDTLKAKHFKRRFTENHRLKFNMCTKLPGYLYLKKQTCMNLHQTFIFLAVRNQICLASLHQTYRKKSLQNDPPLCKYTRLVRLVPLTLSSICFCIFLTPSPTTSPLS